MLPYVILAVGLLFALLLLLRWAASADLRQLGFVVKLVGGLAAVGLVALVIATERVQLVLYLLPFALPLFFHWRSNQIRKRNAQGPSAGGRSEINTGWLRMELDHDSGAMRGTVERGRFAGRGLVGMSLEELLDLLDEVGADADSVGVLEAYLDRAHGPDWRHGGGADGRSAGGQGADPRAGGMTEDEALEILGLAPGATADDIKEAHRRLMAKIHPDRGGSTYLAAKLNQAKDFLLKRR